MIVDLIPRSHYRPATRPKDLRATTLAGHISWQRQMRQQRCGRSGGYSGLLSCPRSPTGQNRHTSPSKIDIAQKEPIRERRSPRRQLRRRPTGPGTVQKHDDAPAAVLGALSPRRDALQARQCRLSDTVAEATPAREHAWPIAPAVRSLGSEGVIPQGRIEDVIAGRDGAAIPRDGV